MPPRLLSSRVLRQRALPSFRRSYHPDRTIHEYDIVLLKHQSPRNVKWRFTPVLRHDASIAQPIKLPFGSSLSHKDLIGRKYLDVITDSNGREVTLYEGSLSGHVAAMERIATPIYPHDAQTIVNMMDLHFDPSDASEEPFEVFEAGTGAGSLTIHIARALAAANPPLPAELREALPKNGMSVKSAMVQTPVSGSSPEASSSAESSSSGPLFEEVEAKSEPETESASTTKHTGGNISTISFKDERLKVLAKEYIPTRKAILHTLDHKPNHTQTAYNLIRRFRRGLYLPHIDFHCGSISSYLTPRLTSRSGRPFLSRAVLDLPAAEKEAGSLIPCLHPNATLIVFAPSISQIGDFIKWSTETDQPLRVDRVAELVNSTSGEYGVGVHEGGRSWRVKTVVPKVYRGDKTGREFVRGEEEGSGELVQIMRPKVGERVCGGGFVAVLRRIREGQTGDEAVVADVEDLEEEIRSEGDIAMEEEDSLEKELK